MDVTKWHYLEKKKNHHNNNFSLLTFFIIYSNIFSHDKEGISIVFSVGLK
jgi:hypothetical protein